MAVYSSFKMTVSVTQKQGRGSVKYFILERLSMDERF
jgi:hypothetical protein